MARRDLVDMYCTQEDYNPPLDKDLTGNTQYPNLNSEEYRRRFSLSNSANNQEFHENLISNANGQVLLVTNDYRRRLWSGSFSIFSDVSALLDQQPAVAQHPCQSPISTVVFQSNEKVLFGTATGSVELWEVLTAGKEGTVGVYKVDSKSGHCDVVSKVVLFQKNKNKFVSSSYEGCLKIWDLENREMMNTNTYHDAHSSAITDLSVHPEDELFVSVSRDKSALIWDHRQVLPATGLLTAHPYHLTCCNWADNSDNPEVVVIGDAKGDVFQVDRRVPDKMISLVTAFNRPLRKIGRSESAKKWILCGNSTDLKVSGKSLEEVETIFSGEDWVRDFLLLPGDMDTVQVLCMNGAVKENVQVVSE